MHDVGCSFLWDWGLVLDDGGKWFPKARFHDNKIPVTIFEQLINFIEKGMINLFELIDLLL